MFLIRWISGWPLGLLHALGGLLGWIAWALSPTYRRRLRANARLAGIAPRDQRRAIASAGRMVAETPWLWLRASDADLARLVRWRNPEELDAAIAERRPLVILTPHMGSFEVCARAYTVRWGAVQPVTVLYRPAKSRRLREFQEESRRRPTMPTAPASLAGVRQMLRALKRRESVGLLPDQVPPEGQGVWAPFFRLPAYTMTLAARLMQQTGADCFVLRGERLPRGRGWVIHASRLVRPLPAGTDREAQEEAAAIVNETMEQVILQDPGQYLWGYNRYKQPRAQDAEATALDPEGTE
ncbi:MAG TPA: lysophospholipid acyltransferase family protein [Burkholderiaceae bacterium]